MKDKLGDKLSPVLKEIADTLWESEAMNPNKPDYTKDGFESIVKIFMSGMMDKIWELQEDENIPIEDRINMVHQCGVDVRNLIKQYTNLDSHDFYKD